LLHELYISLRKQRPNSEDLEPGPTECIQPTGIQSEVCVVWRKPDLESLQSQLGARPTHYIFLTRASRDPSPLASSYILFPANTNMEVKSKGTLERRFKLLVSSFQIFNPVASSSRLWETEYVYAAHR